MTLDIAGPQAAFSPSGAAGVGFTLKDQDDPGNSTAFMSLRSSSGVVSGATELPGAQEVLGVSWAARALELLTGDSPAGASCCSSVSVSALAPNRRLGNPHLLVSGLAGSSAGELVSTRRRLLATVASERGVWVAQANARGRWGTTRRLAGAGAQPESVQSIALPNGNTRVAWAGGRPGPFGPRSIFVAGGTADRPPAHGRIAVTVARTQGVDELAIAPRGAEATAAWIESWYDRRGNYHSAVVSADLSHPKRSTRFAVPGTIASELAFVGDGRGNQVVAWSACTWSASCSVRAVIRSAGKRFGRTVRLGTVDAGEAPAAAVSSRGEALVGWIDNGHVLARDLRRGAKQFSRPQVVSRTEFAANLALAFGPSNGALAAWSQGTFAPEILGAIYRS